MLVAITTWAALGVQKDDYNAWHFTREKFFGKDTYAGGADKCSHFILSAFLGREHRAPRALELEQASVRRISETADGVRD